MLFMAGSITAFIFCRLFFFRKGSLNKYIYHSFVLFYDRSELPRLMAID